MVAPEWVVQHPHSAREQGATNRAHGFFGEDRDEHQLGLLPVHRTVGQTLSWLINKRRPAAQRAVKFELLGTVLYVSRAASGPRPGAPQRRHQPGPGAGSPLQRAGGGALDPATLKRKADEPARTHLARHAHRATRADTAVPDREELTGSAAAQAGAGHELYAPGPDRTSRNWPGPSRTGSLQGSGRAL